MYKRGYNQQFFGGGNPPRSPYEGEGKACPTLTILNVTGVLCLRGSPSTFKWPSNGVPRVAVLETALIHYNIVERAAAKPRDGGLRMINIVQLVDPR